MRHLAHDIPTRVINRLKIAIATADNVVVLFDEQGVKRDKFKTKPADGKDGSIYTVRALSTPHDHIAAQIRGLAFSPDSTKLAVAQSDGLVAVFKLGTEWGEKKAIVNKFTTAAAASITALCWGLQHPDTLLFGAADGKVCPPLCVFSESVTSPQVRTGTLSTNKTAVLCSHPDNSPVVALCINAAGTHMLAAHAQGQLLRGALQGPCTPTTLCTLPSAAVGVVWTPNGIVAACADGKAR